LFQIGDFIIYPMQGAGVIEAIEEKEVLGKKQQYYVINLASSKMQVMIPIGMEKKSGIRLAADKPTLRKVLNIFYNGQTDTSLSMKERYKINFEKFRTGNIKDGAEVVRDLMRINKNKPLNQNEKHLLESARKIFISELSFINGISVNQANDLLSQQVV
jgi:CarD family transcriptional regulator